MSRTRKAVFIIAAIAAAAVVVWLLTQDWDGRRIRKNLNLLAATVSKPRGAVIQGVALLQRVSALKTLFTEDCIISAGEPAPQIMGVEELYAVFSQGINTVKELKVLFKDISVNVAPGRTSATTVMTAEATGADLQESGRHFDAREIEMVWKKSDGKWKIASAKEVKTLH